MEQVKKEKTRKLSIYEFFEILQIEWIIADLRLRLYIRQKDKDYWRKVRDGKKVTIEEIAGKNTLPTIFSDSDLKSALEHRIFKVASYPDFHYKDEVQKANQEYYDLLYYYNIGSDIRCDILGEVKVGKIKSYKPFDISAIITLLDGTETKVKIENVLRIL